MGQSSAVRASIVVAAIALLAALGVFSMGGSVRVAAQSATATPEPTPLPMPMPPAPPTGSAPAPAPTCDP